MDGIVLIPNRRDSLDHIADIRNRFAFEGVISEICDMDWEALDSEDVLQVAHAYYYFSVQFRENLEIACRLHPEDSKLKELYEGECATDNLSPWPGVASAGEKLDHDEFMRRLLALGTVEDNNHLTQIGEVYLERTRALDDVTRAMSIASYEDGGLTRVFSAMLRAPDWRGAAPGAFKFFLEQHIRFDSDDGAGHGSLSRHLRLDDRIVPLWIGFRELLVAAVPRFWERPVIPVPQSAARP